MRRFALLGTALATIAFVALHACDDASSDATATGAGGSGQQSANATTDASSTTTSVGPGGGGGAPPHTECNDNCIYVREGASGDGSGTNWTNAMTALPDALQRGFVYFVAAGSYAGYTFDDAESGADLVRVLRAVEADHGTEDDWDAGYGEGNAEFGPLVFETQYYELDGRDGVRVVGSFESTVVEINAGSITFHRCDVDGNFQESGGNQTDGACTGMTVGGDNVIVAGCNIHDAADDGVTIGGSTNVTFQGNTIHALHGCGTDGGCGPCYNGHSDGFEIYDLADSQLIGNMVYDVASTAALFFGNWADELGNGPSEYCENILIANNIMYSPDTGFVAYIEDARNVQVYNNTFWGLRQGAYGGLSIGQHVQDLDLYNNAILSINYTHIGGSYDPAEHRGDYNLFAVSLGQWQDQAHDIEVNDPRFTAIPDGNGPEVMNPSPADFTPSAGSPLIDAGWGGDASIVIPTTDFFGAPRDSTPNIGAIE